MNPRKPSQAIASICLTEWKDESDVPFHWYYEWRRNVEAKRNDKHHVALGNVDTRALMDR